MVEGGFFSKYSADRAADDYRIVDVMPGYGTNDEHADRGM